VVAIICLAEVASLQLLASALASLLREAPQHFKAPLHLQQLLLVLLLLLVMASTEAWPAAAASAVSTGLVPACHCLMQILGR
jgi:hypothetical protein